MARTSSSFSSSSSPSACSSRQGRQRGPVRAKWERQQRALDAAAHTQADTERRRDAGISYRGRRAAWRRWRQRQHTMQRPPLSFLANAATTLGNIVNGETPKQQRQPQQQRQRRRRKGALTAVAVLPSLMLLAAGSFCAVLMPSAVMDPLSAVVAVPVPDIAAVHSFHGGALHSCALLEVSYDVRCWGKGFAGALGTGNDSNIGDQAFEMGENMTTVDFGTGRVALNLSEAGLGAHVCALLDGALDLKCFGSNGAGQLGYGDTNLRGDSPGELGDNLTTVDLGTALPAFRHIVGGNLHSCAHFVDNSFKCWGGNAHGQLLQEDTDDRGDEPGEMGDSLPFIRLGDGVGALHLASRHDHLCVITNASAAELKCWGRNLAGQLGRGDMEPAYGDGAGESGPALAAVSLGAHVHPVLAAAGHVHTCVLLNDSSVKCFGRNLNGELGYGDMDDRGDEPGEMGDNLTTVNVLGTSAGAGLQVTRVSCGVGHSCALISDGSLKCWGQNNLANAGKLGLGDSLSRGGAMNDMGDNLTTVSVGPARAVVSVITAQLSTCVHLNDSTIKCFGGNDDGQLGYGDTDNRGDAPGEMGGALPFVNVGPLATQPPSPGPSNAPTPGPTVSPAPTTAPSTAPSLAPTTAPTPAPSVSPMPTPMLTLPLLAPVMTLHPGNDFTCAQLEVSYDILCWGWNSVGQLGAGDSFNRGDAPRTMGQNLTRVDLGSGNRYAQNMTRSPPGYHTCVTVLPDGAVKCWGFNNHGQLGYENTNARGNSPANMGDFLPTVDLGSNVPAIRQIAIGVWHSCVVFVDDRLKCWGFNNRGQLGQGDNVTRGNEPGEMGDALPFVSLGTSVGVGTLAAGHFHNCIVVNDTSHKLKCWGSNTAGQLGHGSINDMGDDANETGDAIPITDLGSHVYPQQVSCGEQHACARLNDSSVKCWGLNSGAQLGLGDTDSRGNDPGEMGDALFPVDILGTAPGVWVVDVSCGLTHSCALISDGRIKCWGANNEGQVGQGDTQSWGDIVGETGDGLPVVPLIPGTRVSAVRAGAGSTCVIVNTSAAVQCWGRNNQGQLGYGDTTIRGDGPGEMGSALPVVNVGPLVTRNPSPAPTVTPQPSVTPSLFPTSFPTVPPTPQPSVAPSLFPTFVPTVLPTFQPSRAPTVTPTTAPTQFPTSAPSSHPTTTPTISAAPSVSPAPTPIPTLPQLAPVAILSAGSRHACVHLATTRVIRCWGSNANGQLGVGHADNVGDNVNETGVNLVDVDLGSRPPYLYARNITTRHTSAHHCLALQRVNGGGGPVDEIKCWGLNDHGQLGYGDQDNSGDNAGEMGDSLPLVDLGSNLPPLRALASGMEFNCAAFEDARLKCWGRNDFGQLGQGHFDDIGDNPGEMGDSLAFVNLGAGVGVLSTFHGHYHSCARLNDSAQSLKCWGWNLLGQLGHGDTQHKGDSPGEMGEALPVTDMGFAVHALSGSGGDHHTCALLNDSSVKCWGFGFNGRLGTGSTADVGSTGGQMGDNLPPVDLGNGTASVLQVVCGRYHTCVLLTSGMLQCWGKNDAGQLGLGDNVERGGSPSDMGDNLALVNLGPRLGATAISAGQSTICALLNDSTVKCFGDNVGGFLGQGDLDDRGDDLGEMGSNLLRVDVGPLTTLSPSPAPSTTSTSQPTVMPTAAPTSTPSAAPTGVPTSAPSSATSPAPTVFVSQSPVAAIALVMTMQSTTCAHMEKANELRCWGFGGSGELGNGVSGNVGDERWEMGENLTAVDLGTGRHLENRTAPNCIARMLCAVLDGGDILKCFGYNNEGQLGYGDVEDRGNDPGEMGDALPAVDLGTGRPPIRAAVSGSQHTCLIFEDDRVKCFGRGESGQLGHGSNSSVGNEPGEMGDALQFLDLGRNLGASNLFSGRYHTCAQLNDSSFDIKCWGWNSAGQLGYGDASDRGRLPGQMGDALGRVPLGTHLHVVNGIGCGGTGHTCGLLNDSTLKCWGVNSHGQLGYGDVMRRGDNAGEMGDALPAVDVLGSATGVSLVQVSCGLEHTCAVISDGSFKCWGYNNYGQLGYGDTEARGNAPGEMGDALSVVNLGDVPLSVDAGAASTASLHRAVSPGVFVTCARLNDSTVKCWGDGRWGQLGYGDTNARGNASGTMGNALPRVDVGPLATFTPTTTPTRAPSTAPTRAPTSSPTTAPTTSPTRAPNTDPTSMPTPAPTRVPTVQPSDMPTQLPTPTPTLPPTPVPSMAPTQSIETVMADNPVAPVWVFDSSADSVSVSWDRVSDPRMNVVGYRLAMQVAGTGPYTTVAEPAQNWTTVTGLSPDTFYRFRVAVVSSRGVGSLSTANASVTTSNESVIFFENTGVALRIAASVPLPSGSGGAACDMSVMLHPSQDLNALFGSAEPPCTLVNQRTARWTLTKGATLTPGMVLRLWSGVNVSVSAPSNPNPVVASLSAVTHVSWCSDWTADASSSTGVGGSVYPLTYNWWVSSLDAGNAAAVSSENSRLSFFTSSTNRVLFNATHFAQDSVVAVHVRIVSTVFNLSATAQADTNISALDQPTVSIVGSTNRTVFSFQDLSIRAAVSTPECFSGSANSSVFSWAAVQGAMPVGATTTTKTLFIPALALDVTQTYIFRVSMTLDDYPLLSAVTANVQVSTQLTPPVVALADGTQRTVGCAANTTLDASQSYDPNVCAVLEPCGVLTFSWTCVGCDFAFGTQTGAVLDIRLCDYIDKAAAFASSNSTALQLDVTVISATSALYSSESIHTTVLASLLQAPPTLGVDVVPDRVNPDESLFVCTTEDVSLSVFPVSDTLEVHYNATGTYFIVPTKSLVVGVLYEVSMRDLATGVGEVSLYITVNEPPTLGTLQVFPQASGDGSNEPVLDFFDVESSGHVDDAADLPLSLDFAWATDGNPQRYESLFATDVTESLVQDVAFPAGSNLTCTSYVSDRLGSSATLQITVAEEIAIEAVQLWTVRVSLAVDWTRPGAMASALLSWEANRNKFATRTSDLIYGMLLFVEAFTSLKSSSGSARIEFDALSLMSQLVLDTPSEYLPLAVPNLDSRLLLLANNAFVRIRADELTAETCAKALTVVELAGEADPETALVFLTNVADSGCGEGVFATTESQLQQQAVYVNLSAGCNVFVQNARSDIGEGVSLDERRDAAAGCVAGFALNVSDEGVQQITVSATSQGGGVVEFVDTRSATLQITSAGLSTNTTLLRSDVHELELRPSALPCTRQCNAWEGSSNATCTPLDVPANTSGLPPGAVQVGLSMDTLDKCGEQRRNLSCLHVQVEDIADASGNPHTSFVWSSSGCELVDITPTEVICHCNHLTAFAVGSLVSNNGGGGVDDEDEPCGSGSGNDCDGLGGEWAQIYDHPGYAAWLSLLCAGWIFVLVTDAQWFFDPETKRQRSKFTMLVFVSYLVIVVAVLRILYLGLMLVAYSTADSMACAEFGVDGSGSVVPPYALFAVHDIFYPLFLTLFSAVFLYWIDLAEVLDTNMGRAQTMLFMERSTQKKVICFNVILVLCTVAVKVLVLLAEEQSNSASTLIGVSTSYLARAHLFLMATIFILEAVLFIWGRVQLGHAAQNKQMMLKVDLISKVLCGVFLAMGLILLALAVTPITQSAVATAALYSGLLAALELFAVRSVYATLHNRIHTELGVSKNNGAGGIGSAAADAAASSFSSSSWLRKLRAVVSGGGGRGGHAAGPSPVAAGGTDKFQAISPMQAGGKGAAAPGRTAGGVAVGAAAGGDGTADPEKAAASPGQCGQSRSGFHTVRSAAANDDGRNGGDGSRGGQPQTRSVFHSVRSTANDVNARGSGGGAGSVEMRSMPGSGRKQMSTAGSPSMPGRQHSKNIPMVDWTTAGRRPEAARGGMARMPASPLSGRNPMRNQEPGSPGDPESP